MNETILGQRFITFIEQGNEICRECTLLFSSILEILELERDSISLVSTIWFGSLAAIVAFTGSILAFASFALPFERDVQEEKTD